MFYDVIIIGGGAAGMSTAIKTKTDKHSVLLIDHNPRIGKKILSTGNGKCNLTNRFCKTSLFDRNPEGLYPYYPQKNKDFIETVIRLFDADGTLQWFQDLGILCEEKDGCFYPLSEQASVVLDALRYAVLSSGCEVMTDYQPVKISYHQKQNLFVIDDEFVCRRLVLACGGMSAPKSGSDGSGFELAKQFGHTIIKPLPALCGLHCDGSYFKSLQGVRTDCRVRLYDTSPKKPLLTSRGNVQFNSYGVSGIPVMQLSSAAGRWLEEQPNKKALKINLEFLPSMEFEEIVYFVAERLKLLSKEQKLMLPAESLLTGLLNKKIAGVILKEVELKSEMNIMQAIETFNASTQYQAGISCGRKLEFLDDDLIFGARIAGVIKHFSTKVTGVCGFAESQVTSGGVEAAQINPATMESRLMQGLYFAGEIIDVDGICGGYNLQWAWSTAEIAARAIRASLS